MKDKPVSMSRRMSKWEDKGEVEEYEVTCSACRRLASLLLFICGTFNVTFSVLIVKFAIARG